LQILQALQPLQVPLLLLLLLCPQTAHSVLSQSICFGTFIF
jgi:hypothetical protein